MSLVVSLRIADGLVIAADSLSTVIANLNIAGEAETTCPHCSKQFPIKDLRLPPIPMATGTMSFTEKLVPLHERFAVGLFGMTIVAEKTAAYHVRKLESTTEASDFPGVSEAAEAIANHLWDQLSTQIDDLEDKPDDFMPLGAQVVGYDADEAKTVELQLGKKASLKAHAEIGCTASGDIMLLQQLLNTSSGGVNIPPPNFAGFSLQDAVEYAEFLIDTTGKLQRFSPILPSVGGDVDIGVITEFDKFDWIKHKDLTQL